MYELRRNDFDVTNSVQVSSTAAVSQAVREFFAAGWPGESFDRVAVAFEEFERLFSGRMPGYHGVDTIYHDRQHSLDMTLAMARLLVGYESTVDAPRRFGAERAIMALVTSLFHDAGYIREFDDRVHHNGAEFTLYHVTRSARFLARFLPTHRHGNLGAGVDPHRAFHRIRDQAQPDPSGGRPRPQSADTCSAPPT